MVECEGKTWKVCAEGNSFIPSFFSLLLPLFFFISLLLFSFFSSCFSSLFSFFFNWLDSEPINRRWRFNRYNKGNFFKPHFDAGFVVHSSLPSSPSPLLLFLPSSLFSLSLLIIIIVISTRIPKRLYSHLFCT